MSLIKWITKHRKHKHTWYYLSSWVRFVVFPKSNGLLEAKPVLPVICTTCHEVSLIRGPAWSYSWSPDMEISYEEGMNAAMEYAEDWLKLGGKTDAIQ